MNELVRALPCFGGRASLRLAVRPRADGETSQALDTAAMRLRLIHNRLTRFDAGSELCRLNRDPRTTVDGSLLLCELAAAVRWAGEVSGGLVDATCLSAVEQAGYRESRVLQTGLDRDAMLAAAPSIARPAIPDPATAWSSIAVDRTRRLISRPPGTRIDSGGLAKGVAADLIAATLERHATFVVDAAGDIRFGGVARVPRTIEVQDPFTGDVVANLSVTTGAVATSGITHRSWLASDGSLRHHVIDPRRGHPAWTGLLQVTALAPSALEAEVRAKAALLAGPQGARRHLPHGGVVCEAAGDVIEVQASQAVAA